MMPAEWRNLRPVTQYWMADNNNNDSDYTMPLKEADPHNLAMFNTRFHQNIYRGSALNEHE